jgi:hypothetical protein
MRIFRFAITLSLFCCDSILAADPPPTAPPSAPPAAESAKDQTRPPRDDTELRFWLENMIWHHGFSSDEMRGVTGMDEAQLKSALAKFDIRSDNRPARAPGAPLLVLPYPGGRHPRIGFLDGAIAPQRETKLSVFAPWTDGGLVVLDVPEAVWSNLGLTYLAHTHVDTIWTKQGVKLPQLEWNRRVEGSYDISRVLPNKIAFGVEAHPSQDHVSLRMWLRNGTAETLSDLRVQMCAMLKQAKGFEAQTNDNKVFHGPFSACRDAGGRRWIIQAWTPIHRAWGNPPCPCLHADPKFPDCPPGETREVYGWLSFFEGTDIRAEMDRIDGIWPPSSQKSAAPKKPGQ